METDANKGEKGEKNAMHVFRPCLVALSGPSCVGKSPLRRALQKFYPQLAQRLKQIVRYTSRAPRPGEKEGVDYYFRPREEVMALADKEDYLVIEARGDVQALNIRTIEEFIEQGFIPFLEGNPLLVVKVWEHPRLCTLPRWGVFLSPLSREEIIFLKNQEPRVVLADFIAEVMRRKLLRRTQRQKSILSLQDFEEIERRAKSAYYEMQLAWKFDWVLPNHDGEDSDNWEQFYYPLGEARRTLLTFVSLLEGKEVSDAEKWEKSLLDSSN